MKIKQHFFWFLVLITVLILITVVIEKPQTSEMGLAVHQGTTHLHLDQNTPINAYNFVDAARIGAPAVVHIKSKLEIKGQSWSAPNPFHEFFGDEFWDRFFGIPERENQPSQFKEASGSGVIIEPDGYIVTNNHVIDQATYIEVVLHDRRTYEAKLVGKDPLTDLALLSIDEEQLPHLKFGDSDKTQVGEWVLAVGNPFYNLSSTVTAGIISAKARNINILQDQAAIESFLQTDAAVNRGNSGGALLNIQGDLIGINTAIASPTGVYAGYAFAIPSNIVQKVVDDLMKYGEVKRAHLGVFIRDLDSELVKKLDLKNFNGVLVDSLIPEGAAQKAGIKAGDIILKIDQKEIESVAQLQAIIGTMRPQDKVMVTLLRADDQLNVQVELKGLQRSPIPMFAGTARYIEKLGAEFENLNPAELKELGVTGGVKLIKLHDGKLKRNTTMKEGFVILEVDRKTVRSVNELENILKNTRGGILIEGIYPGRQDRFYYALGI